MEFTNQDKSMGIPASFRYVDNHNHHPNPDPVTATARRMYRVEDHRIEMSSSPDRSESHTKHYATTSTSTSSRRSRRGGEDQHAPSSATTVTAAAASSSRYKECQKNHAAHTGNHVLDGCGEFMPTGEEGTPEFMRCAACECHRNFHRKETETANAGTTTPRAAVFHPVPLQQAPVLQFQPSGTMMAFGGGGGVHADQSSSEDLNALQQGGPGKRFRTKFSEEQKGKMGEFAEKIGWRMQKQDEEEVQRFCVECGVKRQVFKVWMHNNRQAIKRKHS